MDGMDDLWGTESALYDSGESSFGDSSSSPADIFDMQTQPGAFESAPAEDPCAAQAVVATGARCAWQQQQQTWSTQPNVGAGAESLPPPPPSMVAEAFRGAHHTGWDSTSQVVQARPVRATAAAHDNPQRAAKRPRPTVKATPADDSRLGGRAHVHGPVPLPSDQLGKALQWVAETNGGGHRLRKPMPPEFAALLIKDTSFQPGPRPAIFDPNGARWVYKETISEGEGPSGAARRTLSRNVSTPISDRWHNSGGAKNSRDLPVVHPVVRRRYGAVEPRHSPGPGYVYHEYMLLDLSRPPTADGKMVSDRHIILYHVMPRRDSKAGSKTAAPVVSCPTVDRAAMATMQAQLPPRPVAAPAPGRGTALRQLPMKELNTDEASVRAGGAILTLRAPADTECSTFVRFDKGGKVLGAIQESGRGVKLLSTAGDVAEWHRVRDDALAAGGFQEGDVVGLWDGELSRKTNGADMTGVITRKPMVAGSMPRAVDMHEYDTVAYVGRVPVRVRGPAKSGAHLGASGYEDGTAAALTPGSSEPRVGTVLQGDLQTSMGERLLEISVSTPGGAYFARNGLANCRRGKLIILLAASLLATLCLVPLSRHFWQPANHAQEPIPSIGRTPVRCDQVSVQSAKDACKGQPFQDHSCSDDCVYWMSSLLDKCPAHMSTWGTLTNGVDVDIPRSPNLHALRTSLAPDAVLQFGPLKNTLFALDDGILQVGDNRGGYISFNTSSLRGRNVTQLVLTVTRYTAALLTSHSLGHRAYRSTRDNIFVRTVEGPAVPFSDDMIKAKHSPIIARQYDIGDNGVARLILPLSVLNSGAATVNTSQPVHIPEQLRFYLTSTSHTEHRYIGTGSPKDRWSADHKIELLVTMDPVNATAWTQYNSLPQPTTVNAAVAAGCILGDPLEESSLSGPLKNILLGLSGEVGMSSVCPGALKREQAAGVPAEFLEQADQTVCEDGASWPACCSNSSRDMCTSVPLFRSDAERCDACPKNSSGLSTYQCFAMPPAAADDVCTQSLAKIQHWCSDTSSFSYLRMCGRPKCRSAIAGALDASTQCAGRQDMRLGSPLLFPTRTELSILFATCLFSDVPLEINA
eukprot:COSAG01_NODE_5155_length_4447_cov_8.318767_2_plen_1089_part_00